MALTKGQKNRRNTLIAEAKVATTQSQAEGLWNRDDPKIIAWVRATLLGNPKVWQWIKPLHVRDQFDHEFVANNGHKWLINNTALSDLDLVELKLTNKEPLKVLQHPGCGDKCLAVVAELWETAGADSMDCVPRWASEPQIKRMYELRPSCEGNNATLGYAAFCAGVAKALF